MSDTLSALLDHLAWADARVLAGLRDSPGSDPRALELFAHVLGAEHVWLMRLRGEEPRVEVWPTLTLEACGILAGENAAELRAVLDAAAADDDGLQREVSYVNSAGRAFRSTVADILLHVALHGSYHRGQVALLVRQSGGVPASTDYIALARGAPAATRG
jgi:uncharacterized damage-inducible protein DinB